MQGSLRDKKVGIALNGFVNEARLCRLNYKKVVAMCLTLMEFEERFQNISKYTKILLEVYNEIRSNNQHGRMPIGNYWRA